MNDTSGIGTLPGKAVAALKQRGLDGLLSDARQYVLWRMSQAA